MATSRIPQPLNGASGSWVPPRTPGPLGYNDQADPMMCTLMGDSPGSLGFHDWADAAVPHIWKGVPFIHPAGLAKSSDGKILSVSATTTKVSGGSKPDVLKTDGAQAASKQPLAWGKKVSEDFKAKVIEMALDLVVEPNYLMAAMAFESGETFSPSVLNRSGSGAVGLIQFMPSTAAGLGTTSAKLSSMTAVEQLDYVHKYFKGYRSRLKPLDDVYMVILWPAAVGKPGSYVLFDKDDKNHPKRYLQNKGLDKDQDGKVTKNEAAAAVKRKLDRGMSAEFYG
jgi:hypothetical protein